MAVNESDDTQVLEGDDIDELAGEELFDVPPDLLDQSDDPPAPPQERATDPKGPPDGKPAATQPRDDTGKFVEQPKDATSATAEGQPPEPASDGSDPELTSATTEPAEPDEPEFEFSFRADGQAIPIAGSKITKDFVMIPRQHMGEMQKLMSYGVTYNGSFRQRMYDMKREVEETKAQVNEDVERAGAMLKFFADMLDKEESGEPAVEAWLDDFRQNRVRLEAEATLAAAKAHRERRPADVKLDGFDDDPQAGPEMEPEELHRELASELSNRIRTTLQSEGIRGLLPAELTRIQDSMTDPEEIDRYFRRALEDIPEHGIKQGQIVALDGAIAKQLKYQAQLILGARQQSAELAKAVNQNQRNGANKIPPAVPVNGEAPKKASATPKFKNRAEMEEWFANADPLS